MLARAPVPLLVVFFVFINAAVFIPQPVSADLKLGFYQSTCPQAETIVRQLVQKRFNTDKSVTAALLRMHFHDCFIKGCDASILIDSTSQKQSEKAAGPNFTVREFDLIDQIKTALEAACPSRVSCADVIALATRDAVALAGGPNYPLPTGRLDSLTSDVNDVNLPGPTMPVSLAFIQFFEPKGFTLSEMVTLLGAHTVGVAHCAFFQDRISNFQGSGKPDPAMDPALAGTLRKTCSASNNPTAFLDQNTSFAVDASFYRELTVKRGVMQIDQELATDPSTSKMVSSLARNESGFRQSFAAAMVKMGSLVGKGGQVRKSCRVFNPKSPVGGGARPPVASPRRPPVPNPHRPAVSPRPPVSKPRSPVVSRGAPPPKSGGKKNVPKKTHKKSTSPRRKGSKKPAKGHHSHQKKKHRKGH
ncbi:unnamed protein product [Linum trigynum]|uniref:Peroxidase n=1 Tax=Linum trigynum TaxID=586398 RepID=A0AAV2E9S1_9ROSI